MRISAERVNNPLTPGTLSTLFRSRSTMVAVSEANTGSVRFVNCAFWGPCNQIARIAGRGTVGFSDCTFMQWDGKQEGRAALQVQSGTVVIRGCEFQEDKPQIELGEKVPQGDHQRQHCDGRRANQEQQQGQREDHEQRRGMNTR